MEEKITLPPPVLRIIDMLGAAGFRADTVGGCVRDMLMGVVPHDYDFTTEALPGQIRSVFDGERLLTTGAKHGTVTLVSDGVPYEITTYRVDGEYTDHRHPAGVHFTRSLAEDLARRDFTMNAMCFSPMHGLTDLYGGERDIRLGVVRTVGEADLRFEEDALRILRALRFSSVLGFELEEYTALSLRKKSNLLGNISAERIDGELVKLFSGKTADRVCRDFADVLSSVVPGTLPSDFRMAGENSAFLTLDAWERFLLVFAQRSDAPARLSAACMALRTDRRRKEGGAVILCETENDRETTDTDLLRLASRVGAEKAGQVLRLQAALGCAPVQAPLRLHALLARHPVYRIGDLAVRGEALSALGLRGEQIGQVLSLLLDAVMEGTVPNREDALLAFAARFCAREET